MSTAAAPEPKLGIVGGGGSLPLRLMEACRRTGRPFFALGLDGAADPAAPWDVLIPAAQVGRILAALRAAGCARVVLAGHIARPDFSRLKPDWKGLLLLPRVVAAAARGDDALLRVFVEVLEGEGFAVVGAEEVLSGLLLGPGPLGRLGFDPACKGDLDRAVEIVRLLGRLDVGQGAVVADGHVLAVEAAEGTDGMLARVAGLRAGWQRRAGLLLKLPKPQQDRRIDLPTIGPATVAAAAAAGLAGIAGAAGATLVVDAAATAAAADAAGLFVFGLDDA